MKPRTLALLTAVARAAACDTADGAESAPARVVAVKAAEEREVSPDEFCDTLFREDEKPFRLPGKEGGEAPRDGRAIWLVIWATWCKPCIEEMPRLTEWQKRLAAEQAGVNLLFLSVDRSAEEMEAFRKQHGRIPPSLHLKDADALEPWMQELGLNRGAGLPVHVFADGRGKVRCVRAASVGENDFAAVRRLLRGLE
jgi:thiol-disulfide isomerase/thioredoxin